MNDKPLEQMTPLEKDLLIEQLQEDNKYLASTIKLLRKQIDDLVKRMNR